VYSLVRQKSGGAKDCDERRGMAAQPDPRGAVSDGWSLLNVLRAKAHRRQGRGAAGAVRCAGGGGGPRTAAPGGAERRVDGVRLAITLVEDTQERRSNMRRKTAWLRKAARVFDTRPRNASDPKNMVWLERDKEERQVLDAISVPGVHVCIDGPTGTGKTSLALTGLGRLQAPYVAVQITKKMTWTEFCKNLVRRPSYEIESSISTDFTVGIESGLPTGKFQVTLGRKKRKDESLEEIAKGWTEHDICGEMVSKDVVLLIDDFERASDEIVLRVSDMAKLLTQTYVSPRSKLVIVGTDDIYRRLYEANQALEGRLTELSLGAFPEVNSSWTYLLRGFEALKLRHPADSKFESEREKLHDCIRAMYEAADGLPKSLTELGWEITKAAFDRKAVSAHDVISTSMRILTSKARRFRRRFPELMRKLQRSRKLRTVVRHLLEAGVGQIHTWDDVIIALGETLSEDKIEEAIQALVDTEILTQTGHNNDILFFKDLSFAHTLSVVSQNPQKFRLNPREFTSLAQLELPFGT